ncbi:MAG TPA: energy transducer TonB [Verrucomicrobiae bacterium]|nr:energy transducer TonB [Verrucomicrobiae bacterium]
MSHRTATLLLLVWLSVTPIANSVPLVAQQQAQNGQSNNEEFLRRAKSRVEPVYPELARRMSLSGTVKIEVVVAPNGTVKTARIVGGHPVLASAALDAARKWRFEPAPAESTGVIDFKFDPQQ